MRFKICVSGSAAGECVENEETMGLAKEVGREIARQKCILMTGATTGIPYAAALGATEQKGLSIGFSPAATPADHINRYRLPTKGMELVIYTGFGYSGRDLLLTRAADAVIIICGRIGTLHEFSVAFEDKKPIGVLDGSGGITADLRGIVERSHKDHEVIIYESDPKKLVARLVGELERKYQPLKDLL